MRDKLAKLIFDCWVERTADADGCAPSAAQYADHLIAHGVTLQQWIPVGERLPEPEQTVQLLCVRKPFKYRYVCCGFYVPEKWYKEKSDYTWDYECCEEYDEEADDYIVNSGWYEVIHNWDDYGCVGIGDTVTHWMPLPQMPEEEE